MSSTPKGNKVTEKSNEEGTFEDKDEKTLENTDEAEVTQCHLPKFNWTLIILYIVIGIMALVLTGLTISVGVLFGEVSHLNKILAETEKNYSERLDVLHNQLSNLPANSSSASFSNSQEVVKVEDFEELKNDFHTYRQLTTENFTTMLERQAQLKQQTKTSFSQLDLRLESITANGNSRFGTIDENIASLNETVRENREDIRKLFTQDEQIVTRLRTMNDSVQELRIDQQQLKEDIQTNFSKLQSSFDQHASMQDNITSRVTEVESSFNLAKSQLTSQISRASQRIDNQDDRISSIETAQSNYTHIQARHEDRIKTLETALESSGTEQNTNIWLTLTIVFTLTVWLMSG